MRTVILYGELAKRFGKYHRFAVLTSQEAIRALSANFKGFEAYFSSAHHDGYGFKIFVGGRGLRGYEETVSPTGQSEVIRIVPTLLGSGTGWVKIFVGAVLVAGGIVVSGLTWGGAAPVGGAMISLGLGLIIGGVTQLLTSPPAVPGNSDTARKESYIFSGPENTSVQGKPVPVGYGRMIVGSAVISAGIEVYDASS